MAVILAAQDGLDGWQVAAMYVGVPLAAFGVIAAVVLGTSKPGRRAEFPVLGPAQTPAEQEPDGTGPVPQPAPDRPAGEHGPPPR